MVSGKEGWDPVNRFNHTSLVAVFTPTDSPKSICNRCLSEVFSRLHENFVFILADKASNNYTFVCKRHYVDILIEELGLHFLPGNPTYNLTDFSASVLDNHKSVLTSFGIQANSE